MRLLSFGSAQREGGGALPAAAALPARAPGLCPAVPTLPALPAPGLPPPSSLWSAGCAKARGAGGPPRHWTRSQLARGAWGQVAAGELPAPDWLPKGHPSMCCPSPTGQERQRGKEEMAAVCWGGSPPSPALPAFGTGHGCFQKQNCRHKGASERRRSGAALCLFKKHVTAAPC